MNLLRDGTWAVVSQLMCHKVRNELPDPVSDVSPYSTPKRHTEKATREAKFDSFGGPDSMFILAVLYCMCSIRGSEIKITNRFYMYLCSNFKATQQTNFCG